ncbi:unannotated protein [freshwater metagenome]|uniref:Unannotated protein n=1 Tax=freshwater metagenome TaxID=449393 RepID=A0A6J6PWM1_9ZZZZ
MSVRVLAASVVTLLTVGVLTSGAAASHAIRNDPRGKLAILPALKQDEKTNKSCQKKPESAAEKKLLGKGANTVEKRNTSVACEQPPKSELNLGSLSKIASATSAILG